MNTNIYILSVNTLKENTVLDLNIEDKLLQSSIIDAQNIDIQAITGTALYNEVLTLIDTGAITGTTQEVKDIKTLVDDWVMPTLIKYSLLRSLLPLKIAFRNKGLMENSSDNSTPISRDYLTYAENKILNDCEYYSNKLKAYLCDFFTKYPDYNCNTDESNYNTPNKGNSYFAGIHL